MSVSAQLQGVSCYPHFPNEKMEAQELSNVPSNVSGTTRLQICFYYRPYIHFRVFTKLYALYPGFQCVTKHFSKKVK